MTKHQNLTLRRYTKDAIRKYKTALEPRIALESPLERSAMEAALAEAVTMLDWLINAKTER